MNRYPLIKKVILPVFLASSLAVLSASIQANQNTNPPNVLLDAAGLTVSAPTSIASLYRLELRVALPDGKVQKIITDGETINLSALDLPDGSYNYETWAMATNENGKYETGLSRGRFKVVSGQVYIKPAGRSASPEGEKEGMIHPQSIQPLWQKMLTASLDFVIPSAHADNLTVSSVFAELEFDDTSVEGSDDDNREWSIRGEDESFSIYDDSNDFGSSINPAESNFTEVFKIEALGTYSGHTKIDSAPTHHSVVIEDTGNISFANGSMYLSKVGGKLGLGTITPDSGIHSKVAGKTQVVKLENTAHSTWTMGQSDSFSGNPITDGDFQFNITANGNGGPTGTQLSIKDENGNVGLGTSAPLTSLHLKRSNAVLTVEDTNATAAVRQILKLSNKGAVGFQMRDTTDTHPWDFRTGGGGSFLIANLGTAGPEVFVSKTGLVKMGPNVQNFTLAAAGNLTIPNGSVTATNFVSSSSRTVKTDFTKVDPAMVMDKLKQLDVSGWRYKDEDVKGRHIGPIAEDFYKLFELGPDNKHISATDMASIALIVAKELQKKSDATNAKLEAENEKLQERLASLEKLVTNLASANGHLKSSGAKVALK